MYKCLKLGLFPQIVDVSELYRPFIKIQSFLFFKTKVLILHVRHRDLYLQWQITDTKSIVKICKTQTHFASTSKPCFHLFIFILHLASSTTYATY